MFLRSSSGITIERRSLVMPEHERKNTAYHESGHAVVAKLMTRTDPVHKVTIIPRGRALGVTMQLPAEDRYSMDREMILQNIAVLFGGRIAEEVFMGQMTTGASNDFERATDLARSMVTRWGMSAELGPMVYGENEGEVFLGRSVTVRSAPRSRSTSRSGRNAAAKASPGATRRAASSRMGRIRVARERPLPGDALRARPLPNLRTSRLPRASRSGVRLRHSRVCRR